MCPSIELVTSAIGGYASKVVADIAGNKEVENFCLIRRNPSTSSRADYEKG